MKRILILLSLVLAGSVMAQSVFGPVSKVKRPKKKVSAAAVDVGSPVAWWKIVATDTNIVADFSGNGWTGIVNGATIVTTNGTYITFAGTTHRINFEQLMFWTNTAQKMSASLWVYDAAVGASSWDRFLDKTSDNQIYAIFQSGWTTKGCASFQIGSGTANEFATRHAVTQMVSSAWMHLVLTYDGSRTASGINAWYNAVKQGMTIINDNLSGHISLVNTNRAWVADAEKYSGTANFVGSLDDFRCFTNVLTGTQITNLYTQGRQ